MAYRIEVYEGKWHLKLVFALWMETLGNTWPISEMRLEQVLETSHSSHFVAYQQDLLVGFIATAQQLRATMLNGHISVVLVAPQLQRQGIATALHEAAFAYFRTTQIQQVLLGAGEARFWPGVPQNLPRAGAFFEQQGCAFSFSCYDLIHDLRTSSTPSYVQQRMVQEGIRFEQATQDEVDALLDFEQRAFPQWLRGFRRAIAHADYADMLLARDQTKRIIGSLLLFTPQSHSSRISVLWSALLGNKVGAITCVGIADAERGRGAGLAMVAHASALLKAHGVEKCYIDWVVLTDFYGKLGYQIWRGYNMANERVLQPDTQN